MTMSADLPGTETSSSEPAPQPEFPRLYVACPLTGLSEAEKSATDFRVQAVKTCIKEFTDINRADPDRWPLRVYAPFDFTPPSNEGITPTDIYEINLEALTDSDGLIVITDRMSSAGVGQEIEWATRLGLPVLYLTSHVTSRQIRGIPHTVTAVTYESVSDMVDKVGNWLTANRTGIVDGPRRRADRELAYLPLTTELSRAWEATADKTSAAYRARLLPGAVISMLKSASRVAMAPLATLHALANELGVSLSPRNQLTYAESVAWTAAAMAGDWDAGIAEKVRIHAQLRASTGLDLESQETWTRVHAELTSAAGR